jgi:hypothetical protein
MDCSKSFRILSMSVFAVLLAGWSLAAVQVRPASEMSGEVIDWMKKVADRQLTQSIWNSSVSWERGGAARGAGAAIAGAQRSRLYDVYVPDVE